MFLKLWFIQPNNTKYYFLITDISLIQRLDKTYSICF